ncbi:MAG: CDP-alcohol phosphatidyltransferase family protein [Ignavibacteriaceae bacterium]|nr:CDP-alcohol phosphatidyltransferase family protein [Ignavibacteriaceae bacterium]
MKINFKEIKTSSNLLSLFRLLLAIPLWFLLDNFKSDTARYATFFVCILGSVTDIMDGYLARKFNQVTEMGKIIDPLADKVVIGAIIIKLFLIGQISATYFSLIIGRDVLIFIGGIIVTKFVGRVLPSNILGKITVVNIGLVILLILLNVNQNILIFKGFYYLSVLLIFVSFSAYAYRALEFIKKKDYGNI